jgi:hypothetical protein
MANAGIYYGRPSTVHKIDFTDSSVTHTTAFSADTSYVMLCAKTAGCHFVVASTPTATVNAGSYLPKDEVILIKVSGGDKIGAIREASTSGSLYATEMV